MMSNVLMKKQALRSEIGLKLTELVFRVADSYAVKKPVTVKIST